MYLCGIRRIFQAKPNIARIYVCSLYRGVSFQHNPHLSTKEASGGTENSGFEAVFLGFPAYAQTDFLAALFILREPRGTTRFRFFFRELLKKGSSIVETSRRLEHPSRTSFETTRLLLRQLALRQLAFLSCFFLKFLFLSSQQWPRNSSGAARAEPRSNSPAVQEQPGSSPAAALQTTSSPPSAQWQTRSRPGAAQERPANSLAAALQQPSSHSGAAQEQPRGSRNAGQKQPIGGAGGPGAAQEQPRSSPRAAQEQPMGWETRPNYRPSRD